jgi:methionine synthase II (cobalamin-independent)
MLKLKGLATGIGSLPYEDAETALDLIFKYLPQIPFWPQLPQRDVREGMVAQFSENLPGLKIIDKGLSFNLREEELESFYEKIISNNLDYFRINPDFALGLHKFYERLKSGGLKNIEFIKCQVTGPFTFAASINDEQGIALLHNPVLMQAILTGLTMKALWQINLFKEFGKQIIVFIDEPYLSCFGSAYTPINRQDVVKQLTEMATALKSQGALIGIHCCGNTDWSIFTEINSIDVISFDAFGFLEKFVLYPENLKNFLQRGGVICWGIIPTQLFTGEETADFLIRKLREGLSLLAAKGIEEGLLLDNLLISPSCGLGTFSPEKAEKIFKLLSEASAYITESI